MHVCLFVGGGISWLRIALVLLVLLYTCMLAVVWIENSQNPRHGASALLCYVMQRWHLIYAFEAKDNSPESCV